MPYKGMTIPVMKRSSKRLVFLQVTLFSMNGIYTSERQENEIDDLLHGEYFSGNRTSPEEVEQKSFVREIKSEKKSLSEI